MSLRHVFFLCLLGAGTAQANPPPAAPSSVQPPAVTPPALLPEQAAGHERPVAEASQLVSGTLQIGLREASPGG